MVRSTSNFKTETRVTPKELDSCDEDEEKVEDLDCSCRDNCSIDESKDEVDFKNWQSKINKAAELNLKKDVDDNINEVEVVSDLENTLVNIKEYDGSEGVLQSDEDIKKKISDFELVLVKEEPQTFITSEQNNFCPEALIEDSANLKYLPESHQAIAVSGENTRYKCEFCDKTYAKQIYLNQHVKQHSGLNLLECYNCQKKFSNKARLAIHVRKHSETKQFECKRCKLRFKHWQSIRKHQLKVCSRSTIECELCDKVVHKRVLKNHMKSHERPEFYECKTCGKPFRQKYKLQRHIQTHTVKKESHVDVNSVKPSLISDMKNHPAEQKFQCELCGSAFNLSSNLRRHMKVHSDEKPYKCDICHQTYKELRSLNNHKLRHSNTRPFPCKSCDKAFFTKQRLDDHTRTHTGEKPFKCDVCDRNFASHNCFRDHIRLHADPTSRFTCDICNSKLKFRASYIRHMKAHEDKKTYPCDICGQNLSSKDYLKKHRELHSGINASQRQCSEQGESEAASSKLS